MQQSRVIPRPRSFACDLATLCAPTLAGLKPASLFRYQPAPGAGCRRHGRRLGTPRCRPAGSRVRVLRQCPRTGAVLVYVYRPARVARLLAAPHMLDFLAGEGYTPAPQTSCWTNWPKGSAAREISRMRSAFFWATRWRMSSGSSKTAAKTLPRAAIGRSTPIPPPRRQSLTAIKSASASTPAAITTAPRSGG